jgi:hypothetical protein
MAKLQNLTHTTGRGSDFGHQVGGACRYQYVYLRSECPM